MTDEFEVQPATPVEETPTTVSGALGRGAAAGAQAASDVWPALGKLMSRTVYGTCYYAAYGATFGALTVASLLPKGGSLEKGIHDGAEAAREAFQEWEEPVTPTAAEETTTSASPA
ncbi:MAG: hypothetical protein WCA32_06745 [Chromatiaceae bacterium]